MKKRLSKDTKIVIGAIAILIVMMFIFNAGITGNPIARQIRSVPTTSVPSSNYGTYCEIGNQYSTDYSCSKAIDGNVNSDWAINFNVKADGNPTNAWIKLNLDKKITINKIILKSRMCKGCGNIKKGTLTFDDGSKIENIEVPYGRAVPQGKEIVFSAPKTVSWIKLEIIQTGGPNAGLSELEIYDSSGKITILKPSPCIDTDSTNDLYKEGFVISKNEEYNDKCITHSRHHKESGSPTDKEYISDECVKQSVGTYWKTTPTQFLLGKGQPKDVAGEYEFSCKTRQYYCDKNIIKSIDVNCPYGCKNGVCSPLKIAVIEFKEKGVSNFNLVYFCKDKESCYFLDKEEFDRQNPCANNQCINKTEYNLFEIIKDKDKKELALRSNVMCNDYPNQDCVFYSLYNIPDWYKKEAKRYGIENFPVQFEVYGPYEINQINTPDFLKLRLPDLEKLANKKENKLIQSALTKIPLIGPLGALYDLKNRAMKEYKKYKKQDLNFENQFVSFAKQNNLDVSKYDIVSFAYFSDKPEFISFASYYQPGLTFSNLFVGNGYSHNFPFILSDTIETVLHETTHQMGSGSSDSYIEGGIGCITPQGIPYSSKQPEYPQSKACIMCERKVINSNSDLQPLLLNEFMVCPQTAKEIGWWNGKYVECYNDKDCGTIEEYCKDKIIYNTEIKCKNPGTTKSYCSFTSKQMDTCRIECNDKGECEIPSVIKCSFTYECLFTGTGFCSNGFCKTCSKNEECGEGFYCLNGACLKSNCYNSFDCGGTASACLKGKCVPCTKDSDCGISGYLQDIWCNDNKILYTPYFTYSCIKNPTETMNPSLCLGYETIEKRQIIETCANECIYDIQMDSFKCS